jgi:hypothetical protein
MEAGAAVEFTPLVRWVFTKCGIGNDWLEPKPCATPISPENIAAS